MTFAQYLFRVAMRMEQEKSWRAGQTYFNVLYEIRPDLSEAIRSTAFDPFYDDGIIPAFLSHICEAWENLN